MQISTVTVINVSVYIWMVTFTFVSSVMLLVVCSLKQFEFIAVSLVQVSLMFGLVMQVRPFTFAVLHMLNVTIVALSLVVRFAVTLVWFGDISVIILLMQP